jgi:subtilisin family serine protease
MRHLRIIAVVSLLLLGSTLPVGTAGASEQMDSVIVTLRAQANLRAINAVTRSARLQAVVGALKNQAEATQRQVLDLLETRFEEGKVSKFTPFWVFNGLAVTATQEVIDEIAARPEVLSVTPEETIEAGSGLSTAPAEPNVALVNAPQLWDLGLRGQGIVVANMDTGVDAGHPDLAGRYRGGANSWFDPNGEHTTPADVSGHGTQTMGVMVGGDAGGTSIGIAPDATWIAVKIFDDAGTATTTGIHQGFQWLLDPDGDTATADAPHVVSNSWTMGSVGCNLEFQLDLQSLRAAGILPVFAAGNFGPGASTSASPANNPEAFAVGAVNNGDGIYSLSSRGPSACGEAETTFPDLVAPGVNVRTSDLFGLYTQQTGTSLAAPHLAGGLALLLDAFPNLSVDQQEEALENGALDLGGAGPDNTYGNGRLDILASYNWLASAPEFTITATPGSASTVPGESAGYTVTVTAANGFADDVDLSLSGLTATEASWSFVPAVITGGSGSSQLTVIPSASLQPGTYPLTITGDSGALSHQVSVSLVVNPAEDFTLSVSPSSATVKRGRATTYTVSVSSIGGYAGAVTLSVSGLGGGATATFSPAAVVSPGDSTMTISTTRQATKGTFTLTVTGQSGSTVHQATTTLIVR